MVGSGAVNDFARWEHNFGFTSDHRHRVLHDFGRFVTDGRHVIEPVFDLVMAYASRAHWCSA